MPERLQDETQKSERVVLFGECDILGCSQPVSKTVRMVGWDERTEESRMCLSCAARVQRLAADMVLKKVRLSPARRKRA